jgi:hypothetical protein
MDRRSRHMRAMTEFMVAEIKDDLDDNQRWLDQAVAEGNQLSRKRYEDRLVELRARLAEYEARLQAA